MNEIISVLPESIANQIAAGEVIERPASVLKELVENALDANAHNIRIDVEDAGRSLLRVSDDGCGMSPMDARMAFERHATSKIHSADDLFNLKTMGFRGEALASIASVAQVELVSRRLVDEVATRILIEGNQVKETGEVMAATGSTFTVRNLFFNVPGRRRFLKSDRTEMNHLMDKFERITLVNPEISFDLYAEGKPIASLPKSNLKKRIIDTQGKSFEKGLIPIDFSNDIATIKGFIGSPETAKLRMPRQYFFVNERFMKHPYFNKAISKVYEKLIPPRYKPNYFIYFSVDPSRIDVNIHPTKTEIKFLDERTIFRLLISVVKQSLSQALRMPSLEFDSEAIIDIPAYKGREEEFSMKSTPEDFTDPDYNPFIDPSGLKRSSSTKRLNPSSFQNSLPTTDWERSLSAFEQDSTLSLPPIPPSEDGILFSQTDLPESEKTPLSKKGSFLTLGGTLIVTTLSEGLAVIDVKRAKERICYEDLLSKLNKTREGQTPQRLLIPELFNFSPSEEMLFEELQPVLEDFGFDISPLGQGGYSLLSVPAGFEHSAKDIIAEGLKKVQETEGNPSEEILRVLALEALKHTPDVSAPITKPEDAEDLMAKLFTFFDYYTPSGKPIFRIFSIAELRNLLG